MDINKLIAAVLSFIVALFSAAFTFAVTVVEVQPNTTIKHPLTLVLPQIFLFVIAAIFLVIGIVYTFLAFKPDDEDDKSNTEQAATS